MSNLQLTELYLNILSFSVIVFCLTNYVLGFVLTTHACFIINLKSALFLSIKFLPLLYLDFMAIKMLWYILFCVLGAYVQQSGYRKPFDPIESVVVSSSIISKP